MDCIKFVIIFRRYLVHLYIHIISVKYDYDEAKFHLYFMALVEFRYIPTKGSYNLQIHNDVFEYG